MENDLWLVRSAVRLLEDRGFEIAVFGGWAENLHGLRPPSPHGDVDLLVLDAVVEELDRFLGEQEEIPSKRLPHKRAFQLDGVMIELFLARRTRTGAEILWWGESLLDLSDFRTTEVRGLVVADADTLTLFRRRRSLCPDGLWDHDFHPDEADVRTFVLPPSGVLRRDDSVVVTVARYGDHVLRHYAFANEWLKVNVTTDLEGRPAVYGEDGFTFNCDIATPMIRQGANVHGVDLFLDVLVEKNGRDYEVVDRDEFAAAMRDGLISDSEVSQAELHLQRLLSVVRVGGLVPWLDALCPLGPSAAPTAMPMIRTPITPVVAATTRPSW